jgi:hypothetical protein
VHPAQFISVTAAYRSQTANAERFFEPFDITNWRRTAAWLLVTFARERVIRIRPMWHTLCIKAGDGEKNEMVR